MCLAETVAAKRDRVGSSEESAVNAYGICPNIPESRVRLGLVSLLDRPDHDTTISSVKVPDWQERALGDPIRTLLVMQYKALGLDFPRYKRVSNKSLKRDMVDAVLNHFQIAQDATLMPLGHFAIDSRKEETPDMILSRIASIADTLAKRGDACNVRFVINGTSATVGLPFAEGVHPDNLRRAFQADGIHMYELGFENSGLIQHAKVDIFPRPMRCIRLGELSTAKQEPGCEPTVWKDVLVTGAFNLVLRNIEEDQTAPVGHANAPKTTRLVTKVEMTYGGISGRAIDSVKPGSIPFYSGDIALIHTSEQTQPAFVSSNHPNSNPETGLLSVENFRQGFNVMQLKDGKTDTDTLARYIINQFSQKYGQAILHLFGGLLSTYAAPDLYTLQVLYRSDPKTGDITFVLHDIDGEDAVMNIAGPDHLDPKLNDETQAVSTNMRLFRAKAQLVASSFMSPLSCRGQNHFTDIEKFLDHLLPRHSKEPESKRRSLARMLTAIIEPHFNKTKAVFIPEAGYVRVAKPGTSMAAAIARFGQNLGLDRGKTENAYDHGNDRIAVQEAVSRLDNRVRLIFITVDGYKLGFVINNGCLMGIGKDGFEKITAENMLTYNQAFNPITHRVILDQISSMFGKTSVAVQRNYLREGD